MTEKHDSGKKYNGLHSMLDDETGWEKPIQKWRARALNLLLVVIAILGLPAYVVPIINMYRTGQPAPLMLVYGGVFLSLLILAVIPFKSYRLRSTLFLFVAYLSAVASFTRLGLAGSGRLYLLALPLVALLLRGVRAGTTCSVISMAIYTAYAALAHFGVLAQWITVKENPLDLAFWIEAGVALLLFMIMLILLEDRFFTFLIRAIIERKQADQELRQQNEYLAALYDTTLGIISRLNVDELLQTIVERAEKLLSASFGWVYLVEGDRLQLRVGTELFNPFVGTAVRRGEGLSGKIWETGEAIIVTDYQIWEGRSDRFQALNVGSTLGAPLVSGGEICGVIGLSRLPGLPPFTDSELDFLKRFAHLASVALDNAFLHTKVQKELEERILTESALRESEDKLRSIVELSNVGIAILQNERFQFVNPQFAATLGYSISELLGRDFVNFVAEEEREKLAEYYSRRMVGEDVPSKYESIVLNSGGERVYVEVSAGIIPYGGKPATFVFINDITKRRMAEQAVQERLEFERLISKISTDFINLGPGEVDKGIDNALRIIGEYVDADRSYVFLFSEDGELMTNTHEWCREGVLPQKERIQNQPVEVAPWCIQRIQNLEVVNVTSLNELPEEAEADKAEWTAQSIQSLVVIPMVYQGSAIGFVGFDAIRGEKLWSEENIGLLRIVGEMFVNALEHKRAQMAKDSQRQFLELLARGGEFMQMLDTLVRIIEAQIPAMLGLVLLLDEDGRHLHIGAGPSLSKEYLDSIEGLEIGPMVGSCGTACYTASRVIVEDIASDPRWDGLRDLALQANLRACWSEPVITSSGKVVGTFAMYFRQPRAPTRSELETIVVAAHLVGIAIEHKNTLEALLRSELRFRAVFEGAPIGISITSLDGRLIETNRALQQMFGYSSEEFSNISVAEFTHPDDVSGDSHLFYNQLVPGKIDFYQVEKHFLRKDGSDFWGRLSLSLARSGGGEPLYAIATTEDITAQRQAAEKLATAYQTMERQVAERTRELAALNAIAAAVSRTLNLREIMEEALERTLEVMQLEQGVAYRVSHADEDGPSEGYLDIITHHGMSAKFIQAASRLPIRGSLIQAAATQGGPLIWETASYPIPEIRDVILEGGAKIAITIPLTVQERLVGALVLGSLKVRTFEKEELALLAAIGQQVGMAVENARLYEQAQKIAILEERGRLARELHDSVTQSVYSVTLYAEAATRLLRSGETAQAVQYLADLRDSGLEALREMRLLIYELRPLALEKCCLADALRGRLEAVEARSGVKSTLTVEGSEDINYSTKVELYQIGQETLNNILKHAHAGHVLVNLSFQPTETTLEVVDDGIGFDPNEAASSGGLGLAGIYERAQRLGADLKIESNPGAGTRVYLRIPRDHPVQDPALVN